MAVENYGGELQDPSIAIASGTIGGEPSEAIGASDLVGFSSVLRQGSNWTGLNKNLIATLQPMNFTIETSSDNKKQIVYVNDLAAPVVAAPIKTDGSMEIQSTWTSAFEGEAQTALEEQTYPGDMYFFRENYYHGFSNDYKKLGNLYFSRGVRDNG